MTRHVHPPPATRPKEVGEPLALCDCERGPSQAPYRLSCLKQGWFVAGFENEGSWVAGGGVVPLSAALCCRPCLPDKLPDGDQAVGLVSLGCHRSTNRQVDRLMCEPQGSALATGAWGPRFGEDGRMEFL